MALELSGERKVALAQEALWRLLNDPQVLVKAIPGCNAVEPAGEDCYRMGLKLQVGSVSGSYMGTVRILEKEQPARYVLQIEGEGSLGFMKGMAIFDLVATAANESLLKYDGSAEVGGVVAGVGQRVLSGVAKFLAGQFFKNLDKLIANPQFRD
ncbi:MAG TPA: carbon monoxide dehydrogenase subunit G [Burkholderiales bacterium]|nr:carbon monoxide dehydrogenase subunit G [Burkholderiales bacterium]